MPPKSIFRQPGARHFQLVHRSQRDPLIHDSEASQHVLKPIERRNGKSRADLEASINPAELAHDLDRANIGEAALYGVYYDDTDYDYMQHMREVGLKEEGVESILLEAPKAARKGKKVERHLETSMFPDIIPPEALPSTYELPRNFDAQREIPDELRGLQPDMDPHLRQVLEALDDDAFVEDAADDDFFCELVADGERESGDEVQFGFRDEGVSDDVETGSGESDDGWEARFSRFKVHQARAADGSEGHGSDYSEGGDTIGKMPSISVIGGSRRRRKANSEASGYSMSSSSMFRNDGLTMLDERFDEIEKEYESDEEDGRHNEDSDSEEAPPLLTARDDFNEILDDFLENHEVIAGKMKLRMPGETGMDKLDTMRHAMGVDERVRVYSDEEDDDDDDLIAAFGGSEKEREQWDCETVLSTYSNLANHPRLIKARILKPTTKIRLDRQTGLPSTVPDSEPLNVRHAKEAKASNPAAHGDDVDLKPRDVISRPPNEDKEDKRARKQAASAEKQARRADKRALKEQYSAERKHQLKTLGGKETRRIHKL